MSTLISRQIDRGVAIVALMLKLKEELKAIEDAMREHAKAHPDEHQPLGDPDREGRQFLALGDNYTVPVLFTADKIVGTFAKDSDKHEEIKAAAGEHFAAFFKPVHAYKNRIEDGKKFRDRADEVLGDSAPAFVTACKATDKLGIPQHDVKIEWQAAAAAKKMEELGSGVGA